MSRNSLRRVATGGLLVILGLSLPACQNSGASGPVARMDETPHATGLRMAVFTGWGTASPEPGTGANARDTVACR